MSAWPENLGAAVHQGGGVYKLPDGETFSAQSVTLTSGEEVSMPRAASPSGNSEALLAALSLAATPTAAPASSSGGTNSRQLMIMAVVLAGFYFLFIQGRGRA